MRAIYDVITRHVGVDVVEREKRIEEQRSKSVSLDQQRLLLQREEDALRRKYTTVRHKKQLPVELKVASSFGNHLVEIAGSRSWEDLEWRACTQGSTRSRPLEAFNRVLSQSSHKNLLSKASISS